MLPVIVIILAQTIKIQYPVNHVLCTQESCYYQHSAKNLHRPLAPFWPVFF
jgi:hypothetical protein